MWLYYVYLRERERRWKCKDEGTIAKINDEAEGGGGKRKKNKNKRHLWQKVARFLCCVLFTRPGEA